MATVRFYSNDKRLSTGRVLKNGPFLQVYPEIKEYNSEDAWRTHWIGFVAGGISLKKSDGTRMKPNIICGELTTNSSAPMLNTAHKVEAVDVPPVAKAKAKAKPHRLAKYGVESFEQPRSFTAPAGDYYVGDLCYALKDDLYENVFGGMGYSSGLYKFTDGSFFMLSHTSCGDGEYYGTNGNSYLVDAGIIGIASMSLCKPVDQWSAGEIHNFPQEVRCVFEDGLFQFMSNTGSFKIPT